MWGANGGGAVAVGVSKPVAVAIGNAEFAANYVPPTPVPLRSTLAAESNAAISSQILAAAIPGGGTNAG